MSSVNPPADGPISPVANAVQRGSVSFVKVDSSSQLEDDYTIGYKLGEGTFGVVYEAAHKDTGTKCAIKKINKRSSQFSAGTSTSPKWLHEIGILAKVTHPNIVRLDAVIESDSHVFLVMELCDGGTLQKVLQNRGKFPESEVRHYMGELCNALAYLHSLNIVHRDLKLDNLLLKRIPQQPQAQSQRSNSPAAGKGVAGGKVAPMQRRVSKSQLDKKHTSSSSLGHKVPSLPLIDDKDTNPVALYSVKLADFGLSVELRKVESTMADVCGTPIFMSPEIVRGRSYSKQCDVWSMGIIMHFLLTGRSPFRHQNIAVADNSPQQVMERARDMLFQEILDWKGPQHSALPQLWNGLSSKAKSVLEKLLHPDPAYRFTAQETLHDPWLTGFAPNAIHTNVLELMKKFHTASSTGALNTVGVDAFNASSTNSVVNSNFTSASFSQSSPLLPDRGVTALSERPASPASNAGGKGTKQNKTSQPAKESARSPAVRKGVVLTSNRPASHPTSQTRNVGAVNSKNPRETGSGSSKRL